MSVKDWSRISLKVRAAWEQKESLSKHFKTFPEHFRRLIPRLAKAMAPRPSVPSTVTRPKAAAASSSRYRAAAATMASSAPGGRRGAKYCVLVAEDPHPQVVEKHGDFAKRFELLLAEEGERWGYYNRIVPADQLEHEARALATRLASGPGFAHMMTKTMLAQEWSMSIEQAVEAEAQAQAICMQTQDFVRAYEAFVAKGAPVFKGD